MAFGFQLLSGQPDHMIPSIKLSLGEVFPLGKFDHLNLDKKGTDIGGKGAYTSRIGLVLSRLFQLKDVYWISLRFSSAYLISSKVHVRGLNAYGGSPKTDGWIEPLQTLEFDFAFELTLAKRWALACDLVAAYSQAIRFKGIPGIDEETGLSNVPSHGASTQYSIAPALEYNWSKDLGLISGVWFTLAGCNAAVFTSWVTALNCNF